jgi:hypothetical protein
MKPSLGPASRVSQLSPLSAISSTPLSQTNPSLPLFLPTRHTAWGRRGGVTLLGTEISVCTLLVSAPKHPGSKDCVCSSASFALSSYTLSCRRSLAHTLNII